MHMDKAEIPVGNNWKPACSAYRLATDTHRSNLLHPNVMKARAAYGNALANSGRLDEGIALLDQARRDAATLFGPSSMTVAVYSQNLVDHELRAGLIRNALVSSEQAFRIFEQSSDRDSYTSMSVQRMHGFGSVGGEAHEGSPSRSYPQRSDI